MLLASELESLDTELSRLTKEAAPALCNLTGVGPDVAGALLAAAGDNPRRLRSEAAFANPCGVAPLPASSGKTNRHRLNRGDDRISNNALWLIATVRLTCHEPTRAYMKRRTAEGMSKREIIRCLKRYVAREVYHCLAPRELALAA
jgi:transposase